MLFESLSYLMRCVTFFENSIKITYPPFEWTLVILAFFILVIYLFVTLIAFRPTTLAGFALPPSACLARSPSWSNVYLEYVTSSDIKVLELTVSIDIGSTLLSQFTHSFGC